MVAGIYSQPDYYKDFAQALEAQERSGGFLVSIEGGDFLIAPSLISLQERFSTMSFEPLTSLSIMNLAKKYLEMKFSTPEKKQRLLRVLHDFKPFSYEMAFLNQGSLIERAFNNTIYWGPALLKACYVDYRIRHLTP